MLSMPNIDVCYGSKARVRDEGKLLFRSDHCWTAGNRCIADRRGPQAQRPLRSRASRASTSQQQTNECERDKYVQLSFSKGPFSPSSPLSTPRSPPASSSASSCTPACYPGQSLIQDAIAIAKAPKDPGAIELPNGGFRRVCCCSTGSPQIAFCKLDDATLVRGSLELALKLTFPYTFAGLVMIAPDGPTTSA